MLRVLLICALSLPAGAGAAEHATWLHGRWWRWKGTRSAAVRSLARELTSRSIRWVFPRAGFLRRSGRTPRSTRAARSLVRRLARQAPGVKVLPWVIGFTHRHLGRGQRWIDRTSRGLARLVARSGSHGVHLDIEPPFGSFGQLPGRRLADLARALKRRRPAALISFAVHPVATPSFPRGLRPENVRPLLAVADQVVVMMYDTALADPRRFARAVSEQVEVLGRLAAGHRVGMWLGAAAYPAHRGRRWRRLHQPQVENVAATARALTAALRASAHAARWRGIAVFARYSARQRDWEALGALWPAGTGIPPAGSPPPSPAPAPGEVLDE